MDHTIKAWDLKTLQCEQMLSDHTNAMWCTGNQGQLEVRYTHNEEHGVIALSGMDDVNGKPVLPCFLNDNSVRLYDLPSFHERWRIFSKKEVRTVQPGSGGIFFIGDGTGEIRVWRWST